MSKLISCLLTILGVGGSIYTLAQLEIDATVTIVDQRATIAARYAHPVDGLRFLDSYAGVTGLASRVTGVGAREFAGGSLDMMRSGTDPAEWSGDGAFSRFAYALDLKPLQNQVAAAHTSWVSGDTGIITLDDLLPQSPGIRTGTIQFVLPVGWKIYPQPSADGRFHFSNADKAAFLIGRNIRSLPVTSGILNIAGEWHFSDAQAAKFASEVFDSYSRKLGPRTSGMQVNILKFPTDVQPDQWEADTRGSTITIVSSDTPFPSQSVQRLHEQLRHEIFHLWFPNGVNLSGNYDWFYEGFALYQSLKLGVAVNRIRFDDYLDTLSRAYNIDAVGARRTSLVDASKNRFNGDNTQVYARGMLVAFLCDLAMLESSKAKRSSDDLVRELYRKYPLSSPSTDGNAAILSLMKASPELAPVADRYITGAEQIDWTALLTGAALEAVHNGREVVLKVATKPSGRQKDILDKLGYNNWRKPGSK